MKKLLTLTSILAAGTLAASAANTLTTSFAYVSASALTITNDNSDITSVITGKYLSNNKDLNFRQPGTGVGDSAIPWITVNNGFTFINTYTGTATQSAGEYVGAIDKISVELWAIDYTTLATYSSTVTTDSVTITATVYDGTTSLGTFSGTWKMTGATADDFSSAKTLTLTGTEIVDVSSVTGSNLNVTLSVVGTSGLTNMGIGISSMAIPEPSMFGLLAGTLALALAGTRRRRK